MRQALSIWAQLNNFEDILFPKKTMDLFEEAKSSSPEEIEKLQKELAKKTRKKTDKKTCKKTSTK